MKSLGKQIWIACSLAACLLPQTVLASTLNALGSALECTSDDGAVLSVKQGDAASASAVMQNTQGKTNLHGTYHVVTQSFYVVVEEYDLADAAGAANKLLVSYHTFVGRGGCGRGACPPVGQPGTNPSINANLEAGGQTLSFECQAAD